MKLLECQYRIVPSITADGQPNYTLYEDYAGPFAIGSIMRASNSDRAVLERAIEHLTTERSAQEQ